MNRRAFFRALGIGAASVVAAPYLPALAAALPAPSFKITQKTLMARVRITEEALAACGVSPCAFQKFIQEEMAQCIYDVKHHYFEYWR